MSAATVEVVAFVINTTPTVVDLIHYAGDTLNLEVRFPAGYVAGRIWTAQVRSDVLATTIDATFTITLGATQDDPVILTLPSSVTRSLVTSPTLMTAKVTMPGQPTTQAVGDVLPSYAGVWDAQLAPSGGGDPTTTVARGSLRLTLDVTRA
jgi:hypothetical protein